MNTYMVHYEHGEYSDWTYKVCGVFSSLEKAKEFLTSVDAVIEWWDGELDGVAPPTVAYKNSHKSFSPAKLVEQADGMWRFQPVGQPSTTYEYVTYFITEYEVDVPADSVAPNA